MPPRVNLAISARQIYVDAYGADPTGVTDSTAAFVAAQTAGGANPYVLVMSVGTYTIGTSSNLLTFGRNQGMVGQGSNHTNIQYMGTATCITAYDSSFNSTYSQAGVFSGFYVNCPGGGTNAIGMSFGNLNTARCYDLAFYNFNGANGVGLKMKNGANPTNWSEEGDWRAIKIVDCQTAVVFDTSSFDYSTYEFLIVALAGQNGVTLQNSAAMSGCTMKIRGNFYAGTGNTAWVLALDPTGGGTTGNSNFFGELLVAVETDGTTGTGHRTVYMRGGSGCQLQAYGMLSFNPTPTAFQGGTFAGGPIFSFSGFVNEPTLGASLPGEAASFQGPLQYQHNGSLTSSLYLNTIYTEAGDVQTFQLASGTNAIVLDRSPATRARRMQFVIAQPSSGAAGTVTWPSNFKFPGGTKTLSATNNAYDLVTALYQPANNIWLCTIALAFA